MVSNISLVTINCEWWVTSQWFQLIVKPSNYAKRTIKVTHNPQNY